MIVEIDGKNLSVDDEITIGELIELAREITANYRSVTELKINGQTIPQSTLNRMEETPICELGESKLELFSTSVHDIILEVLNKATRYIERVENAKKLSDGDVREIIKGFQWLNLALIQVDSYLGGRVEDQIKKLVERNSNFCKQLNHQLASEDKDHSHLGKEIRGELKPYLRLINQVKDNFEQ